MEDIVGRLTEGRHVDYNAANNTLNNDCSSIDIEPTTSFADTDTPQNVHGTEESIVSTLQCLPKDSFNSTISNILLKSIINFYCKPNTPISNAIEISQMVIDVVNFTIDSIKSNISSCSSLEEVHDFIGNLELDDEKFRSKYMFQKYLKESGYWFQPKKFVISNQFVQSLEDVGDSVDMETYHGIIMPIEDQIRALLQLPGMLKAITDNQEHHLKSNTSKEGIAHFCSGTLWKDIVNKNKGKLLIPLMLYNDDFQIDDAIGSHSGVNSVSGFYYQFPSLPDHLKSKLKYIFVAMLTLSKHIKECSPDSSLYMLTHVFRHLEVDGIDIIDEKGTNQKVFIVLTNMQGDNLGIHVICGFAMNFGSTFYCRFCLTPKAVCQYLFENKDIKLRSVEE